MILNLTAYLARVHEQQHISLLAPGFLNLPMNSLQSLNFLHSQADRVCMPWLMQQKLYM